MSGVCLSADDFVVVVARSFSLSFVFVRNEGAVEFVDVEWERFVDVASAARVGVAVIEGWLPSVAG
jgi:hypothetical protein